MKEKDKKTELSLAELSELKQAKDHLETIMDSALDVIVITDSTGNIIRNNKYFLKLLDYEQNEVIGKHISEFGPTLNTTYTCNTGESIHISEEFFEDTRKMYERFVEEKKTSNWPSYFVSKEDILIPVEQNMSFFYDEKENVIGALAIIRDISERKQVEDKLRISRDYLENIIESSLDSIVIVDTRGLLSRVNTAFLKLTGFSEAEVIGKHMSELVPMSKGTYECTTGELIQINEEFYNCVESNMLLFQKKGIMQNAISYLLRKDNKIVPVEDNMSYLHDKDGMRIGAVAINRDITARKQAEEALRKSEEKYSSLIEHANDAIVSVNKAGLIIGFNKKAEEMYGYSREEVLGKPSYLLVSHQTRKFFKEALKQFAKTGAGLDRGNNILEGKAVKKDGAEFQVEYAYYTIDMQEEFIATAIIRDISTRKKEEQKVLNYQEKLRSLTAELILSEQKERQHFADFLHDEIGQQLFATRLQLEQLKGSLSSAKNTKTLGNAINYIQNMIEQSRSLTFELSSPILYALGFEKALEWLVEQAHRKYDIIVTLKDDKQEKPLNENVKILLYQAVRELIVNVAKHAKTKNASVSVNKDNSNIRICVKDNGVGFDPLNQSSSDAKIEGFGLFRISERLYQLGGQIEIESQLNRGTQVTLVAPLVSSV